MSVDRKDIGGSASACRVRPLFEAKGCLGKEGKLGSILPVHYTASTYRPFAGCAILEVGQCKEKTKKRTKI